MKIIDNSEYIKAIGSQAAFTITWAPGEDARPARAADLIRFVLFGLPMQSMTMGDATHGRRVIEVALSSDDNLELEDADYTWLVSTVDEYAPKVLGVNAALLKDAIKPLEGNRADRRRQKRQGDR